MDGNGKNLPKCMYGDGCLVRLTDQKHDDVYLHSESALPKCGISECPLYKKAHDFIIGEQRHLTSDIKEAQKHAALHYHSPIRSKTVSRTRPRAISHLRTVSEKSKETDRYLSVPKLDLESISTPGSPISKFSAGSQNITSKSNSPIPINPSKSVFGESRSQGKSSSDPNRVILGSTIRVSPKRRSSISGSQLDAVYKDFDQLKQDVFANVSSLRTELNEMHQDVRIIRNLLVGLSAAVTVDDAKYYSDSSSS